MTEPKTVPSPEGAGSPERIAALESELRKARAELYATYGDKSERVMALYASIDSALRGGQGAGEAREGAAPQESEAHQRLDELCAPRSSAGGEVYSLVGRINALYNASEAREGAAAKEQNVRERWEACAAALREIYVLCGHHDRPMAPAEIVLAVRDRVRPVDPVEGAAALRTLCACAIPDPVMQADGRFYCHTCSFPRPAQICEDCRGIALLPPPPGPRP